MSLLQAYLQSSKTRRILSRKPGEKGFSLIELVVVIGVLAVLTAIALPGFLGVSDDASARSSQQALISLFKECQILKARKDYSNDPAPILPSLSGYSIGVTDDNLTQPNEDGDALVKNENAAFNDDKNHCFTTTTNEITGATTITFNNFLAEPNTSGQFPQFFINANSGSRGCVAGRKSTYESTYNLGCLDTTTGLPVDSSDAVGTW